MGIPKFILLAMAMFPLLLLLPSNSCGAGKVDILAGTFMINATSATTSATISGPGAYMLDYRMPFGASFDLQVGYSINASKGVGGDLAFGPDLGLLYFPLTTSDAVIAASDTVVMEFREHIKPYLGGSFHQRQYQSTNSTYAGFGGSVGSDFNYWKSFSIRAELRYILLAGPSNATASELDAFVGMTFRAGK